MAIKINEYHGYKSQTSFWKAMCVTIGKYKLYFSYETLIAFETPNKCYVLEDHWSHTTKQHVYSAAGYNSGQRVSSKVLELLVHSELLKIPFEEAMNSANIHCERIH